MKALILKYVRPTDKDYGHTKVYYGSTYLGYFMPNRSQSASIGENWNFEPAICSTEIHCFIAKNRKEVIETLEKQINKQHVILKQHFGLKLELNNA